MDRKKKLDWITYIVNMLAALPFMGLISYGILWLVMVILDVCRPGIINPERAQLMWFIVVLWIFLSVLWGYYQYGILIRGNIRMKVKRGWKPAFILAVVMLIAILLLIVLPAYLRSKQYEKIREELRRHRELRDSQTELLSPEAMVSEPAAEAEETSEAEEKSKAEETSEAEEECPAESAIFKISKGKMIVKDSALAGIRTSSKGDTLEVELHADPARTYPREADIPAGAKKIRLWDCDYDLPPPDHTAYFYSFFGQEFTSGIAHSERGVIQGIMMFLSIAPDRKILDAEIRHLCCSEFEQWKKKASSRFVVADDGQIFKWLGRKDRPGCAPIHYWLTENFKNRGGKLQIYLPASGRFFDRPMEKRCVLREIDLPVPDPRPASIFFVNMPQREKYLAENQSVIFEAKKSVGEFRAFAEKLKLLRCGMTPEETAGILGKPDEYCVTESVNPKNASHAIASYYFLKGGPASVDDLEVMLFFQEDPSGVFRLEWVF